MPLKRILPCLLFSVLLFSCTALAETSSESGPQSPARVIEEIKTILAETQIAYQHHDTASARLAAMDAYLIFEGIEPALINKDDKLGKGLERTFGQLQGQIKSDASLKEVNGLIAELNKGLKKALPLLEEKMGFQGQFWNSLAIIVREGFEAILILAALITFLVKSKNEDKVRHIWVGVGLAVVASLLTAWILETVFEMGAASREQMEGWIMLVAVAMLFWVSYWLVSKVEAAKWQAYISGKMKEAIGTGSTFTLGMVAFISVYREGFETVLFYKALFIQAGESATGILPGFVLGCLILCVVYFMIYKLGVRIPIKWFFVGTSVFLAFMAFLFMGKGLHELQMGNALSITPATWAPEIGWLGMYPTMETFIGQIILMVAYVFAIGITLGSQLTGKAKPQTS